MKHLLNILLFLPLLANGQVNGYEKRDSVSVYFEISSSKINDLSALKNFVTRYRDTSMIFRITSYTDTTGSIAYNTKLGERRLNSVISAIDSISQIARKNEKHNLQELPFAGDKKTSLEQQRRVDIVVFGRKKTPTAKGSNANASTAKKSPAKSPASEPPLQFEIGKAVNMNILFIENTNVIMKESYRSVEVLYEKLKSDSTLVVQLNGHVCCVDDYELSLKRAEAVKARLISLGITEDRITCKGLSNKVKLWPEISPEYQKKNRRVEAILFKK